MRTVYRLRCEFDIGQDRVVFSSRPEAFDYAEARLNEQGQDLRETEEAGLVGTIEAVLDPDW